MKKTSVLLFCFMLCALPAFCQNLNIDLLRTINSNRTPMADQFFKFISNTVGHMDYLAPLGLLAFALIKNDKHEKRKALLVAISVITAGIIVTILKHTVNEARPFVTYPFITKLSEGGSPSFPSGHTSDAFVLATAISLGYRKWYVIAPLYLWAVTVGYSRMYLGAHYPGDVLAGMISGSGVALICFFINKRMLNKAAHKAPNAEV